MGAVVVSFLTSVAGWEEGLRLRRPQVRILERAVMLQAPLRAPRPVAPPEASVAGAFHQAWVGPTGQIKSARGRFVAYPIALLT